MIKVTLFWPCYESERVTGAGHYAWTSRRIQEAGKTTNMIWFDSIEEATGLRLGVLKEAVQDRKKWCMLVEEKTWNRECTNVK
jgi:hypothetical protein